MLRVSRIGCRLSNSVLQLKGAIVPTNQIRCLFSGEELGIKNYELVRKQVKDYVKNPLRYKQNFENRFVDEDCNFTKYETELNNLLHVVEKSESDMILLKEALNTLIEKQSEYEGEKYAFGTVIMRTLYFLDMPNKAIEFYQNKNLRKLFTQVTGHQILLDLLFEHKMYDDLLRIYESLNIKGQLNRNRHINVIVLATYYQLNTPETFQKAYTLWKKEKSISSKHHFRKSLTFVAGLALKQNDPGLALNILEDGVDHFYVTLRQIRLLAWAQLEKFDNVLEMLRSILRHFQKIKAKNKSFYHLTSIPVLDDIEKLLKENGSKEHIDEFSALRREMETNQLVTNKTLDDMMCVPFPAQPVANTFYKSKKNQ
ncbi:pentatricopeptide repeat-containing protein 2, mitochondrial-like [Contarinia nasturtii]|uniref:pentatricopeptide repeat-containing protein 2, mitochondrial-like n=1 Tax=Contarinia nasturtii TaxID=265458 RepID=UPI0012D3908F|nr:pentatricopeptide repeat-containing protein 2, mitochondrial-like [Contarinia nasturtii]XP_031629415.1 pentatricopeptide repeat-containing protein 2, mitochondrial-like [Contarinia nasturtii]